jgi:hypothetical protein
MIAGFPKSLLPSQEQLAGACSDSTSIAHLLVLHS